MAELNKADFRPARERIAKLPKARREKIAAGAAAILEAHHLSELRRAMDMTQAKVAEATGMKQAEVSRIENSPASVQLQTMDRYVSGIGGQMKIIAEFPDGTRAEIPLHHGKPVRSKMSATSPEDRKEHSFPEDRLAG